MLRRKLHKTVSSSLPSWTNKAGRQKIGASFSLHLYFPSCQSCHITSLSLPKQSLPCIYPQIPFSASDVRNNKWGIMGRLHCMGAFFNVLFLCSYSHHAFLLRCCCTKYYCTKMKVILKQSFAEIEM